MAGQNLKFVLSKAIFKLIEQYNGNLRVLTTTPCIREYNFRVIDFPSAKKKIFFLSRLVFFAKRVILMKNSLTDEPELCFYAKTTRRRQNFEKVGVALLFQNII